MYNAMDSMPCLPAQQGREDDRMNIQKPTCSVRDHGAVVLGDSERPQLVIQPASELARVPPHGHDGSGAGALEAACRLAAGAGQAFDLAGTAASIAILVMVVVVVMVVGVLLWLIVLRRGADGDKEEAALEAPNDDSAAAELHGDGGGLDGLGCTPAPRLCAAVDIDTAELAGAEAPPPLVVVCAPLTVVIRLGDGRAGYGVRSASAG